MVSSLYAPIIIILLKIHLEQHFEIQMVFQIHENMVDKQLECSSVQPESTGVIEYRRALCEMVLSKVVIICMCKSHGIFLMSQITKTSENLKTAASASLCYNILLLLLFIFCKILIVMGLAILVVIAM